MLLPAIATAALGTALLVPLRDDRRGRRATVGFGTAPFRTEFKPLGKDVPLAPASTTVDVDRRATADDTALANDTLATNGTPVANGKFVANGKLVANANLVPSGTGVNETVVRNNAADLEDATLSEGTLSSKITLAADAIDGEGDNAQNSGERNGNGRYSVDAAAVIGTSGIEPGASDPKRIETDQRGTLETHEFSISQSVCDVGDRSSSADAGHESHTSNAGKSSSPASGDNTPLSVPPSGSIERRGLLEPHAALLALARPFLAARSACLRMLERPTPNDRRVGRSLDLVPHADDVVVERSFANEVASLLRAPLEVDGPRQATVNAGEPATIAPGLPNGAASTPLDANGAAVAALHTQEATVTASQTDEAAVTAIHTDEATVTTLDRTALTRPTIEPNAQRQLEGLPNVARQNIVVASIPSRFERIVPLTRLPLRPQGFDITWTASLQEFEPTGTPSRAQRHDVLERFVREPGTVSSDVIARAFREEDAAGRTIALRILLRHFPHAGRPAFVEALRVGSDEERALAIDGLMAISARDEITPAFADRVDAIAAKAALAYVGTFTRADYTAELSAYIDESQIAAILKLLAGVVE